MLFKWQLNNARLFPDFSFKNDILKRFACRSAVSSIQTKKLIFFKTSSRVGVKTETSLTLFVYHLIIQPHFLDSLNWSPGRFLCRCEGSYFRSRFLKIFYFDESVT